MPNEPFDESDLTPRPVSVPVHSLLDQVQDGLYKRIDHLGGRLGARLDVLEQTAANQRVWNSEVAGVDAKNGKVSRVEKVIARVTAIACAALLGAGGAVWSAGVEKGDERAKVRALEAQVEDLQQLRTQLLLRLIQSPPAAPALPTFGGTP
jgi:hypothetical protein